MPTLEQAEKVLASVVVNTPEDRDRANRAKTWAEILSNRISSGRYSAGVIEGVIAGSNRQYSQRDRHGRLAGQACGADGARARTKSGPI